MGSIMRNIISIVGRIIIVNIIVKPTSTALEKEDRLLLTSSDDTDLEGVSCRGGVRVSVTVLAVDDDNNGTVAGLCFCAETVQ